MTRPLVNGLDIDRFPRVIQEDVGMIDTFPLSPIPERLDPIMADLLGQLALADAPFSGRQVACILAGDNEGHGGHTVERSPTDIDDPFLMALAEVPKGARLHGIMVTGKGLMKEKHVMPSGKAYDLIAPLLLPGSPILVVPPNNLTDVYREIPEYMHQAAYRPKPMSVFQGRTLFESQVEAIRYTNLCVEDCEFVALLRHSGLENGVHYYLTGSSSGGSGPSFALKPGMYGDLDIIAVSDLSRSEVEAQFEELAQSHYGVLEKTLREVHVAGTDRIVAGCIYSRPEAGLSIDFSVARKPRDAFVRDEYLARNYFQQLS